MKTTLTVSVWNKQTRADTIEELAINANNINYVDVITVKNKFGFNKDIVTIFHS